MDGKRAKADTKLSSGQEVKIPPVEKSAVKTMPQHKPSAEDEKFIRSLILHDDGDVLAFNKPHGLAVQGGSKTKRHIDGYLPALKNKEGVTPRLVHRLDKDTSGLLITARSAQVAKTLGESLKRRQVKKIYLAVTVGVPEISDGTIKAPLQKGAKGSAKEKMHIDEDGKSAITDYVVLDRALDKAALVAFWPRTGRTHQIRAHAAFMGCPILGDRKYGSAEAVIEGMELPKRLHLHALRIVCDHPTQKRKKLDITAPLADDLRASFKALGFQTKFKQDPFEDS